MMSRKLTAAGLILTFSMQATAQLVIPVGGNTFTNADESIQKLIDTTGISHWKNSSDSFITYLRVNKTGEIRLSIKAAAVLPAIIQISIKGRSSTLATKSKTAKYYDAGVFRVSDTGYIAIVLKGLSRKGNWFPVISEYQVSGSAVNGQTNFVQHNSGDFFYWGRRGPSVHLNYPVADSIKVNWFYNEVTVPKGVDKTGSYFMANGFAEGYFGIQVNSAEERRVLFSVWSPFNTDDPNSIPDSLRIKLVEKGAGVQTGEFGHEGAGGQSFLRYNWKAGEIYRFLVSAKAGQHNYTVFSAYIFLPEKKEWLLIASFARPFTKPGLRHLHSFLENFEPETGDQYRKVFFGNQWVRDSSGCWTELNHARFTADNTARAGFRKDYGGGAEKNMFFLENCGFFNHYQPINSAFTRIKAGKVPESVYLLVK